ncbi:hypothetical protein AQZ52_11785 [Novosphingobium fuchskuhlense]|uniref:Uncharacterized protein n=1 Tax=Novosphingobium fuchskuhlense TaxID=1117702 RepID=A0A124JUK5_9SPHN|nr:hypothetical protein [Novosphingobium fuchskuhlense]KUR71327.1 hypothetical protein AQZ52_11785 [Novosphingobium fuchskuhlense]
MTPCGRIAAFALAGLAAGGGFLAQSFGADGSGFPLFVFAALILLGTLFDAGYLARKRHAPGTWHLTAEREIDHQSGQILEVWFDSVTGERRYLPTGERPD